MINSKIWTSPGLMIGTLITVLVLVEFIKVLFPLLMSGLLSLAGLGNFSFSGLFASDGVVKIILSAGVLIAILVILGVKMAGGSKR